MNEELKSLLTSLAIDLTTKVQNGIDMGTVFVSEQAPQLIKEILKIGMMDSIFRIIVLTILTIVGISVGVILLNSLLKERKNNTSFEWFKEDETSARAVWMIIVFIFSFFFIAGIVTSVYDLLYIIMAPRLYIIEQLKILF